jgi:hypothetical protein
MNDRAQLVARYRRLRQVGMEVNHALVETLGRDVIDEGGKKLGILRGKTLVLNSEDHLAILMDFCIHDLRRGGLNAIQRMLAQNPYPAGSDHAMVLESLKDAYYTLFVVEEQEPGLGVRGLDLVRGDTRLVIDLGFSLSATPGLLLASRFSEPEGMFMTLGAALPLGRLPRQGWGSDAQRAVQSATDLLNSAGTPDEKSEAIAAIIRTSLETGAASTITYTEPGQIAWSSPAPTSSRKPPPGVGRYDPCPCGSGKKFKFCCGARR